MKIKHLDYFLLFIVALFLILGISFLATISAPLSFKRFEITNYYLVHQLTRGFLPGIILGMVFFLIPLDFLRKKSPLLLFGNLIALVLVFFIGDRFWGATRWLSFGIISFQPSEFFKITSILYLSSWLKNRLNYYERGTAVMKRKKLDYNFKRVFLPFLIFLAIIAIILTFQKDVSTLGIIGLTMLAIYFATGAPIWHSFLIIGGALSGLFLLVKYEAYRLSRFLVFLNPEIDPMGLGFQAKQAIIAVGSGGIAGRGLGMSSQIGYLPQSMSDSTFAIFAEETGFAGCILLILLFLIFLWLGLMISRRSNDKFSEFAALGITFWIVLQGFVNISSMTGISPLAGIPLPFISYGGSHIVSELIGVGILLNIARHSKIRN